MWKYSTACISTWPNNKILQKDDSSVLKFWTRQQIKKWMNHSVAYMINAWINQYINEYTASW